MLLVVRRRPVRRLDAADFGRDLDLPVLCIHAAIVRACFRFLADQPSLAATRKWRTRFVLLDCSMLVMDGDPGSSGAGCGVRHADDVPDAAGDRRLSMLAANLRSRVSGHVRSRRRSRSIMR